MAEVRKPRSFSFRTPHPGFARPDPRAPATSGLEVAQLARRLPRSAPGAPTEAGDRAGDDPEPVPRREPPGIAEDAAPVPVVSTDHTAYWELTPTGDHVVPLARGGAHDMSNWASTSMLRNQVKGHWTLDELGWKLAPPGRLGEWDGLLSWFLKYIEKHPHVVDLEAVRTWRRAAAQAMDPSVAEGRR